MSKNEFLTHVTLF